MPSFFLKEVWFTPELSYMAITLLFSLIWSSALPAPLLFFLLLSTAPLHLEKPKMCELPWEMLTQNVSGSRLELPATQRPWGRWTGTAVGPGCQEGPEELRRPGK